MSTKQLLKAYRFCLLVFDLSLKVHVPIFTCFYEDLHHFKHFIIFDRFFLIRISTSGGSIFISISIFRCFLRSALRLAQTKEEKT